MSHPKMKAKTLPFVTFEHKRDAYGFTVRPQHLQRYHEYASIYKVEEEERSDRWKNFLERQAESAQQPIDGLTEKSNDRVKVDESTVETKTVVEKSAEEEDASGDKSDDGSTKEKILVESETETDCIPTWAHIRPSLAAIEDMMSLRVKKKNIMKDKQEAKSGDHFASIDETRSIEEDSDDEFYDVERSDLVQDAAASSDNTNAASVGVTTETFFPWKEELECLVRGGVPMALRGELWQAFVGVKVRRTERYYQDLLTAESNSRDEHGNDNTNKASTNRAVEKWKKQIEKDLPRTFPGHPALDDDGRSALRRLLTAYALHNPSVGYCQAMNFFAGLLLLMMPEENAFWTFLGIIDDYFDGYYSEEMIESQVDQLVFEDLVRERFPKLVHHLDYLGVEVAWVTGPWFLSIFVNMLPWESVLRVWDVLLFEGNRVMLFRTSFALMELYGPALVTTKDAGDAVCLLQTLAGSTFDSSQLVLTASMGFQGVNEDQLLELRDKHRPSVIAAVEERSKGVHTWKDSKLASKLYSFKHDAGSVVAGTEESGDIQRNGGLNTEGTNLEFLDNRAGDAEGDFVPDLQEQVVWLKVEMCSLLEEKRSAILRAEELETALMEMVKQDNRRQLSARVEMLEQVVAELRQALTDKQEQERAMLQVLMRVEQDQKVTEDARRFAEQDAAAQRYATNVLQEKYEDAMSSLAQMEKRVVMAESMLEATLQYQSGQVKAQASPRSALSSPAQANNEAMPDIPTRKISLLSFGLGWRDKNKAKQHTVEETDKSSNQQKDMNGHEEKK